MRTTYEYFVHASGQFIPCFIRTNSLHHHVCRFFPHVSSWNLHVIVLFHTSLHASLICRPSACKHVSIGNHTHFPEHFNAFPRKKEQPPIATHAAKSAACNSLVRCSDISLNCSCDFSASRAAAFTSATPGAFWGLHCSCFACYDMVRFNVFLAFDVCCVDSSIDMFLFASLLSFMVAVCVQWGGRVLLLLCFDVWL